MYTLYMQEKNLQLKQLQYIFLVLISKLNTFIKNIIFGMFYHFFHGQTHKKLYPLYYSIY